MGRRSNRVNAARQRNCNDGRHDGAPRSPRAHLWRHGCEPLEDRLLLSVLPPPPPITPTRGESNLLRVVQMMSDKQNLNAQDHFPVPYTVVASAGTAAPTVVNWKAGPAFTKLDADQSKATGQGGSGHDIQVSVNTDKYTNAQGKPDWRLRLNVERLGSSNFAQNVNILVSFPFDAFNTETNLPGAPNIVMGFQTRLAGAPGTAGYVTGLDGGIAPVSTQIVVTPHVLAGTVHDFEWDVQTSGASNPITFISGEFDGNNTTKALNALGWQAYVQNVPSQFGAQIKVAENAIGSAAVDSKMDLRWTASSRSLAAFDYFEAESAGSAAAPASANYETQIVADTMPTDEHIVLRQDEAGGKFTLVHDSNAPINGMTFLKRRSDGLTLTGVAADANPSAEAVPTHVDLTLGLRGNSKLDVNANTLDLLVQDSQVGGFNNTSQFFEKYNLEYVSFQVKNATDSSSNFDGATKTFTASATNANESSPWLEMVLDDDGRISATNAPLNLALPDKYGVAPAWNLWSITDDGKQGTAAARALDAKSVNYDHDAPAIKETVELQTTVKHPLQTYLRSGLLSAVQPPQGPAPDPYIEVTGHIEDVPTGHTKVTLDFPLTVLIQSESKIGEVCLAGHIGFLNFALVLEDNPTNSSFDFRPEGSLVVKALNDKNNTPANEADDVPDLYTANMAIVSDVNGFDPTIIPLPENYALNGFHSSNETFFPNNTKIKEARLRVDKVPSFRMSWDDQPQHTYVDIKTVFNDATFGYVGGIQFKVSTVTTITTQLTCDDAQAVYPPATNTSQHYALLKDVAGEQALALSIFGVHEFHFATDDVNNKYSLDFTLNPTRPATAANVVVDTHPTSTGALGTFFGGSEVTGPLTLSYVPPDMHIQSDFDPSFSTQSLFPGGLPVPLVIQQQMVVNGTQVFVYLRQVPQNFTVTWNVAATSTLSITATDNNNNPDRAQVVEVLFSNPNGLPGGSSLFGDPAHPLRQLLIQADDVPSLNSNWTTTGNPHVNIDTAASGGAFQYIGSLRLLTSTTAAPASPVLPTYAPPAVGDDHYVNLQDVGASKSMAVGVFGVDNLDLLVNNAAAATTIAFNGNSRRKLKAMVNSVNGNFFSGHTVDAGLVIDTLPTSITATFDAAGRNLSYNGSGAISSIQLGGSDLINLAFNPSTQSAATYDGVLTDLAINALPNKFSYSLNPAGSLSIVPTNTLLSQPNAPVSSIVARLRSDAGIPGTDSILGSNLKDVRLRLDSVPAITANWSAAGKTTYNFAANDNNLYVGGAQLAMSTAANSIVPFNAPAGGENQTLTIQDRNGQARLLAQLYGIHSLGFSSSDIPKLTEFHYSADVPRKLVATLDTRRGSKLTSASDTVATLMVDKLPSTWDFTTDTKRKFKSDASDTIQNIDLNATIDDSDDNAVNPETIAVRVRGLPKNLDVQMTNVEEAFEDTATLHTKTHKETSFVHASGPLQELFYEQMRDLPSPGVRPSWNLVQVNGMPGKVDIVTVKVTDVTDEKKTKTLDSTNDITVTDAANNAAPLTFLRTVSSKANRADTIAQQIGFFTGINGGLVKRSAYEAAIDNNYYKQSVLDRLNDIYNSSFALGQTGGALMDHVLTRKYGELVIPGVAMKLTGNDGADVNKDLTTDADGFYTFAGLKPGTYAIEETQPGGVGDGKPNPVGSRGGTYANNKFSGVTIAKVKDQNGVDVIQNGQGYSFGEKGLPNTGLAPGGASGNPNGPGTLSGRVYWDENDDGLYQADDLVDFTDVQLSNFQTLHTKKTPDISTVNLEVPNPTAAQHPFFYGDASRDEMNIAKVENLPSTVNLDFNKKEHLHIDTSTSAGRIDFYDGAIGGAIHGQDAIRAILLNTPTSVHLDYKDIGKFPGGATFKASNQFEVRLLKQDASSRIVAGLQMEDAVISYGIEGPTFEADVISASDLLDALPDTGPLGVVKDALSTAFDLIPGNPSVPTALGLFKVFAKLDLKGDSSNQGASGFFSLYETQTNPHSLDYSSGTLHDAKEYVPTITAAVKDFQGAEAKFELQLDPKPWEQLVPGFPFDVEADLGTPQFGPGGGITLDFWDKGLFDISIGPVEVLGVTIFPELTFTDKPDYASGNPWHLIPVLINLSGPLDPFN